VTTDDIPGFVLQCQGDVEYAEGHYPRAEELYREAADCEGVGDWPLIQLGRVLFRLGAIAGLSSAFDAQWMRTAHIRQRRCTSSVVSCERGRRSSRHVES
jgi:hypothetical protein